MHAGPVSRDYCFLYTTCVCMCMRTGVFQWAAGYGFTVVVLAFFLLFVSSGLVESSMVLILI